jgi:hypothetical protein
LHNIRKSVTISYKSLGLVIRRSICRSRDIRRRLDRGCATSERSFNSLPRCIRRRLHGRRFIRTRVCTRDTSVIGCLPDDVRTKRVSVPKVARLVIQRRRPIRVQDFLSAILIGCCGVLVFQIHYSG